MGLFTSTDQKKIPLAWKNLLKVYTCFALTISFSNTFINTYLMRATGSEQDVMIFNIVLAAVQPFSMITSVYLMRKTSPLITQRIGFLLYAAGFLVMSILGEGAAKIIHWISAALAVANGFFFTTYALQLLNYVDDNTRDASYGIQNALQGVINIALPALTGLLIAAFHDFTGYRITFILGFAVCMLAVVLSKNLKPLTNVSPKAHVKQALKSILTEKPARAAMLVSTANGFYTGTMAFFVNILIYAIVKNEAVIGFTNTAAGIATIAASMLYARIVRPDNRTKSILLSVLVMLAAAGVLLIKTSLVTLIIFHLLLSFMNIFFVNPTTTAYFATVENMKSLQGLGGEVHALREFWYSTGRVAGILLTMLLSGTEAGSVIVIIIILTVQLIPAKLMKIMQGKE